MDGNFVVDIYVCVCVYVYVYYHLCEEILILKKRRGIHKRCLDHDRAIKSFHENMLTSSYAIHFLGGLTDSEINDSSHSACLGNGKDQLLRQPE